MSYDIQLFKKLEDTTVEKSAATVLGSDTYALDPESFHFQGKALSRALKKLNPQLEEFSSEGCLTLSSAENGIQISIFPNQISITMPYWHTNSEAKQAFVEIFSYLEAIQKETGYSIYNPQSGSEMSTSQGVDVFLETYLRISESREEQLLQHKGTLTFSRRYSPNYFKMRGMIIFLVIVLIIFLRRFGDYISGI